MIPEVEVGKRYEFQTVTFYWVGTVRTYTPGFVTLDDVIKVYETGEASGYYGKTGTRQEKQPDGTMVAFNMCVAITPWTVVK